MSNQNRFSHPMQCSLLPNLTPVAQDRPLQPNASEQVGGVDVPPVRTENQALEGEAWKPGDPNSSGGQVFRNVDMSSMGGGWEPGNPEAAAGTNAGWPGGYQIPKVK